MSQIVLKVIRVGVVILVLMASLPTAATAQLSTRLPEPAPVQPVKRWSISVGGAGVGGGPAAQFEGAMRSANFDDPSFGANDLLGLIFCLFCDLSKIQGTDPNPASDGPRAIVEYDVTYRRNNRLALGVILHQSDLGTTRGNQAPLPPLYLDSKTTVLAPVAYVRLGERVRVGAGPLAAWTEVRGNYHSYLDPETAAGKHNAVTGGAILTATIETRPRGRVYFAVTASQRWIVPVNVGPFTTRKANITATLPAIRANLSHAGIGANLGIRF